MKDKTQIYISKINEAKTLNDILAIYADVVYRGAQDDYDIRQSNVDVRAVQRAVADRLILKGDQ